ncbi:hypothetical protein VNI00_002672 [Paramarasmius palmivorus]|uniref:F-box domain-containing protein n=1 Tax=Paramarasmius palmivorus TaxID=297713 RepID=A0AAW0DUW7_9AGAR
MAATKRKDPETKDPPARKRRKTLQSIVEMPIDILYEIFSHLHPNDLLRLSWATKALREILMSRTSASVWKASREEIGFDDSMIPTFCDLNEPTLAKMLFCPICTYCGTVKATQITWNAFSRVCKDCSYANFATPYVMREIKKIPIHPQFPTELWDTLPYTLNDAIGSVDFRTL